MPASNFIESQQFTILFSYALLVVMSNEIEVRPSFGKFA